MAYAYEDYEKEKEDEQKEGAPKQLGAESGIVQQNVAPTEQGQQGSGQYVNLENYLKTNAPRQFGTEFAGQVGKSVTGAEEAQKQAETGFKSKVGEGSTDYNEELVRSAAERPEEVYADEARREAFKKQRDARYQGPENLVSSEYYSPAQQATRKAGEEGELIGSESGRKSVLDRYYGSGVGNYRYTPGQQNLDLLLVSQDPNARNAISEQQQRAQQAGERFGQLQGALSQYAQGKKASTEQAAQKSRELVGGAYEQTRGGIESGYQQAMQNRQNRIAQEKTRLGQGKISGAFAGRAGLQGGERWGVDPSKYFQEGAAPTIHQYVSPEQRGKYSALSGLLDQGKDWLPYGDLAGTYSPDQDMTFDANRYRQDVAAEKAAYEDLLNRRVFGQTQAPGTEGAQFGAGTYFAGQGINPIFDQYFGQGDVGVTPGSLQQQLDFYNNPQSAAYVAMQGGYDPASYRAKYAKLQGALNALRNRYGYGTQLELV